MPAGVQGGVVGWVHCSPNALVSLKRIGELKIGIAITLGATRDLEHVMSIDELVDDICGVQVKEPVSFPKFPDAGIDVVGRELLRIISTGMRKTNTGNGVATNS